MSRIAGKQYFADRTITEVTVPVEVEAIGEWAFASCPLLSTIRIPAGCKVADKAFAGSVALGQIILYENSPLELVEGVSSRLLALSVLAWPRATAAAFEAASSRGFWDWFDPKLSAYLKEADDDGFSPFQAGGEEDYDEEICAREEYVSLIRLQKAGMIFERLLEKETRPSAALREECVSWLKQYNPQVPFALMERAGERGLLYEELYFTSKLHLGCGIDTLLECAGRKVELRARILREFENCSFGDTFLDALKL